MSSRHYTGSRVTLYDYSLALSYSNLIQLLIIAPRIYGDTICCYNHTLYEYAITNLLCCAQHTGQTEDGATRDVCEDSA